MPYLPGRAALRGGHVALRSSQREAGRSRSRPREFPRLRAVVWAGAMFSAGILAVLLFFSFVGEINFSYAYVAGVLIIFLAAYFFLTWGTFERSKVKGNTRPEDRERRGF